MRRPRPDLGCCATERKNVNRECVSNLGLWHQTILSTEPISLNLLGYKQYQCNTNTNTNTTTNNNTYINVQWRNVMFSFHVMYSILPSISYGKRTKMNVDILKSIRDSNPLSISDRGRRQRGPAKRSLIKSLASAYIQSFTKDWKISGLRHSLTRVRNISLLCGMLKNSFHNSSIVKISSISRTVQIHPLL
jgi:hypothetical protein